MATTTNPNVTGLDFPATSTQIADGAITTRKIDPQALFAIVKADGTGHYETIQDAIDDGAAGVYAIGDFVLDEPVEFPNDRSFRLEFAPTATISTGEEEISMFKVPAGGTTARRYEIRGGNVDEDGSLDQSYFEYGDDSGLAKVDVYGAGIKIKTVALISDFDENYTNVAFVRFHDCNLTSPNVPGQKLAHTSNSTPGSYNGSVTVGFHSCRFENGFGGDHIGWGVSIDGDLEFSDSMDNVYLAVGSEVDGFFAKNSIFILVSPDATPGDFTIYTASGCQYEHVDNCAFLAFGAGVVGEVVNRLVVSSGNRIQVNACEFRSVPLKLYGSQAAKVQGCWLEEPGGVVTTHPLLEIDSAGSSHPVIVNGCTFTPKDVGGVKIKDSVGTQVVGCGFVATGSPYTVLEEGSADQSRIDNCVGLNTGAGVTLVGAASRIDGVQVGNAASVAKGMGKLFISMTPAGNAGGGTDTLQTADIPAKTLARDLSGVRWTAWGTIANNSNPKSLVMNVGGTAVLTFAMPTSVARNWRAVVEVFRTSSGNQRYVATLTGDATTVHDLEEGTLTKTDTAAITCLITGTVTDGGGGINDNDIVCKGHYAEVMN